MIVSGALSKHLTLQRAVLSASDASTTWADVVQIWGCCQALSPSYIDRNGRDVTHKITVRARDDIQTGMRLVLHNRSFLIRDIIRLDETNTHLELRVIETKEMP